MTDIEYLRNEIRNLESALSDPYSWEKHRDNALRALRKISVDASEAIEKNMFTPGEVLAVASLMPDYVSLTADDRVIKALKIWIEANKEKENTTEIRLYTEEAERMLPF